MKHSVMLVSAVGVYMGLFAAPAFAQYGEQMASPPPAAPAPAPAAMSGPGRGLGVGATVMLSGPGGLQIAYDAGAWHLEGLIGASDQGENDDTDLNAGARFWFHVHQTSSADFSVGGGVGFLLDGRRGPGDAGEDQTSVHIDAGAQIRAFIVSNVALSGTAGIGLAAGDKEGWLLSGQLLAGMGVTYYFH